MKYQRVSTGLISKKNTIESMKILGIIFCGGKSLRMGTDKELISLGQQNWAQHAFEKLSSLGLTVKVSINPMQKKTYINYFQESNLIVDDFPIDIGGPLLGLLSAHLKNPLEDHFVLACDTPLMNGKALKKLIDAYRHFTGFEAYVFENDGRFEPLCAIYTASALKRILGLLETGEMRKHSMKEVLYHLNIKVLKVEQEDIQAFENFNSYVLK